MSEQEMKDAAKLRPLDCPCLAKLVYNSGGQTARFSALRGSWKMRVWSLQMLGFKGQTRTALVIPSERKSLTEKWMTEIST